jgi:hypothetical protein
MRDSLLLLPMAVLGLAGCASGGAPSHQRTPVAAMTPELSATYMTPEQSATLILLPGDTTTLAQMRFLATTSLNEQHRPATRLLSQR